MSVNQFLNLATYLERAVLNPLLKPYEKIIISSGYEYAPNLCHTIENFLETQQSNLSRRLPLMNPLHVLGLIFVYFGIVFGGKWMMTNVVKHKFQLKYFSRMHNAFLMYLSAYMALNILYQAIFVRGYKLFGNYNDNAASSFPVFEFVDTFIMVGKMNFRQISFLHLYHHSSIFAVWWLTIFMAPTSEAYFSAFLNSVIHVIMYGYYLVTSLGIASKLAKAIKPFITMSQMIQFCCMMVQATYNIVVYFVFSSKAEQKKQYPIALNLVLWFYMWTMLGLFANFYMKSYAKKPKFTTEYQSKKAE